MGLGTWSEGSVEPKCVLPGSKRNMGEIPKVALQRVLKSGLSLFLKRCFRWTSKTSDVTYKKSVHYGVPTRYMRITYHAELSEPFESGDVSSSIHSKRTSLDPN